MIRLLQSRSYQRSRWKNDGGWTTEIASEPMPEGVAGFRWRVSIADIESDGPFSTFPGIDRDLLLLSGKGMDLSIDDADPVRLDRRFQAIHFSGEAAVACQLLAGPTRDFNVMVARDQVSAEIHARPLNGTMLVFVEAGTCWLIHVFAGSTTARADDQIIPAEVGETLLIESDSAQRERVVIEGGGELILVKFSRSVSAT